MAMFHPAEHLGTRVEVFLDLHSPYRWVVDTWAGTPRSTRKVRLNGTLNCGKEVTTELVLRDCNFYVHQAGRVKVLREGRKQVHAWIVGTITSSSTRPETAIEVTYNPRLDDTFVVSGKRDPITHADHAWLTSEKGRFKVFAQRGSYVGDAYPSRGRSRH